MRGKTIATAILAGLLIALPASAAEIITAEDLRQKVITEKHLVRVADNALFILDASSSMNKKYKQTGKSTDLVWSNYKFRSGLSETDFDSQRLSKAAR